MILQSFPILTVWATIALATQSPFPGLKFDFPHAASIPTPLNIHVDRGFLNFTLEKVRGYTSLATQFANWTSTGPPGRAIKDLANFWAGDYNWTNVESLINKKFNHYAITVPGDENYTDSIPIHFIHEESNSSTAMPLLLLHGWGSSHLEWDLVTDMLVQQSAGNRSFHIVAVDLPGFGFSPAPIRTGLGAREMAVAFDKLMKQLGYDRYGLVSTDIGWFVGMQLVDVAESSIVGHFMDAFPVVPTESDLMRQAKNETTEEENIYMNAVAEWTAKYGTHLPMLTQKPEMVALAFADTPVGFASWLWDLKHSCSNGYPYSNEEIITDTMMQWIQSPYGSIRTYHDLSAPGDFPHTDVPSGVTVFGFGNEPFPEVGAFSLTPRSWIERRGDNLTYYNRYEFGGHWPAKSVPDLWVEELRKFFTTV
ncbi:alpha/beta-hydrolase [Corynespora cassiicola Philippines]|uniref:Alpha/beta-hydrolase n=1 Tax=Corynespora cassiicola Philippines TaxID=1448308 RepID=A0A2T2NQ86_CORCC|nr:alpha/beta-hydrolase [Corynespora cassiicola Philippines]